MSRISGALKLKFSFFNQEIDVFALKDELGLVVIGSKFNVKFTKKSTELSDFEKKFTKDLDGLMEKHFPQQKDAQQQNSGGAGGTMLSSGEKGTWFKHIKHLDIIIAFAKVPLITDHLSEISRFTNNFDNLKLFYLSKNKSTHTMQTESKFIQTKINDKVLKTAIITATKEVQLSVDYMATDIRDDVEEKEKRKKNLITLAKWCYINDGIEEITDDNKNDYEIVYNLVPDAVNQEGNSTYRISNVLDVGNLNPNNGDIPSLIKKFKTATDDLINGDNAITTIPSFFVEKAFLNFDIGNNRKLQIVKEKETGIEYLVTTKGEMVYYRARNVKFDLTFAFNFDSNEGDDFIQMSGNSGEIEGILKWDISHRHRAKINKLYKNTDIDTDLPLKDEWKGKYPTIEQRAISALAEFGGLDISKKEAGK